MSKIPWFVKNIWTVFNRFFLHLNWIQTQYVVYHWKAIFSEFFMQKTASLHLVGKVSYAPKWTDIPNNETCTLTSIWHLSLLRLPIILASIYLTSMKEVSNLGIIIRDYKDMFFFGWQDFFRACSHKIRNMTSIDCNFIIFTCYFHKGWVLGYYTIQCIYKVKSVSS